MADRLPENLLGRGFDPPSEVAARPFGAPTRVPVTPVALRPLAADFKGEEIAAENIAEPPPDSDLLISEEQITDKLRSIAMLLRSLTCEEMWKLCDDGLHKPGMEKELIAWAKTYMGEPVTETAPVKLRRA